MPALLPPFTVQGLRWLNEQTFVLRVDRNDLAFRAGQCISLGVWGAGVNREYSLYSGEGDDYLEVIVRVVSNGTVTPALAALRPGDRVYVAGPYSDFVRPPAPGRLLLLATCTGIAPFHSFARTQPDLDFRLVHGVRTLADRHDHDRYPPERYISCVSREDGGHFRGRVTDWVKQADLPADELVYLCGNRRMIEDAFDLLRERGVPADQIRSEVFF